MSAPSLAQAIALLEEIHQLLQLKGENPFKVRAFEKAQGALESRSDWAELARAGQLTEIPGIGKGIAQVLTEFFETGKSATRDELAASVPAGLVELSQVPGLGPKKALLLIETLGIQTLGELEYACRENRLIQIPGFGIKLQNKVLEGVEFLTANRGQTRLGDVWQAASAIDAHLKKKFPKRQVARLGALARQLETLTELTFGIEGELSESESKKLTQEISDLCPRLPVPFVAHAIDPKAWGSECVRLSASPEHWAAIGSPKSVCVTEQDFYASQKLPWIAPELRETGREVSLARAGKLDAVLAWDGVRGIFHNHTLRSDGTATLDQMVNAARAQGYEYIGISDHSQSAVYAQGLKGDVLKEQEKEVREAQERHPDIRIFWGIESDILADGSLDYPDSVLKKFDFVIASIHSRFQMEREAMTDRLLAAVRNPFTTMIGHWSGRLLLGRKPYDFDAEKVIREAGKLGVPIEINAHPTRLDIDWRWGQALAEHGTLVSINPDAHSVEGILDTRFGVAVARKALLERSQVLNSRSTAEVTQWLAQKKRK